VGHQVNVAAHTNLDGTRVIALWLSPDALAADPSENPVPGVALSPARARELANKLLALAEQLDPQGLTDQSPPASDPL
jgi:hypothetical protein